MKLEYELGECIGRGGHATVHRATLFDGRVVAVKRLHGTRPQQLLADEADKLRSLRHPNIVRFYGIDEHDDEVRLIQEFVDGETLATLMCSHRLPIDSALSLARSVLEGLEHVHASGLVHRDLAPSNILISRDGTPKIADFGIAKVTGTSATTGSLVRGSPSYLSPEQITQAGNLDGRCDLFVVGLLLFELLVGQRPFTGTPAEVTAQLMSPAKDALPVATVCPEVPDELSDFVARLLEKDPNKRHQSAREAIEAMDALPSYIGGRPELVRAVCGADMHLRPHSPPSLQPRWLSRRALITAQAVCVGLGFLGGFILADVNKSHSAPGEQAEAADTLLPQGSLATYSAALAEHATCETPQRPTAALPVEPAEPQRTLDVPQTMHFRARGQASRPYLEQGASDVSAWRANRRPYLGVGYSGEQRHDVASDALSRKGTRE
ncbi:serine/threonine-protein kinase [Haliangium sp.]|uniref:serine/threonine-protein kinase n=1 Tax=Haliangium sp. TaxID=2663208 RepID=UPI003D0C9C55